MGNELTIIIVVGLGFGTLFLGDALYRNWTGKHFIPESYRHFGSAYWSNVNASDPYDFSDDD